MSQDAHVQVVRGTPDDVELLAALVAGLMATAAVGDDDEAATAPTAWSDRARRLGRVPSPGPTAWRWSLHP